MLLHGGRAVEHLLGASGRQSVKLCCFCDTCAPKLVSVFMFQTVTVTSSGSSNIGPDTPPAASRNDVDFDL